MRCPRCQASLLDERFESVRLHACPEGHGAILTLEDRRTLTVSARATLEHALETPREGRLACAVCHRGTDVVVARRHGDEIELDACAGCGAVWFDAGEVARIQELPPKRASQGQAPRPGRSMGLAGGGVDAGFHTMGSAASLIASMLDGW